MRTEDGGGAGITLVEHRVEMCQHVDGVAVVVRVRPVVMVARVGHEVGGKAQRSGCGNEMREGAA